MEYIVVIFIFLIVGMFWLLLKDNKSLSKRVELLEDADYYNKRLRKKQDEVNNGLINYLSRQIEDEKNLEDREKVLCAIKRSASDL